MRAVLTAIQSDLRRRRLQTLVIAVVILVTSGAATLALSLVVETDAPYRHAFAAAHGAHLTVVYDAHLVSPARLSVTAHTRGVVASAGPWPEVLQVYTVGTAAYAPAQGLTIAGRPSPNTDVDRITLEAGRWVRAQGEVVVSRALAQRWGLSPGSTIVAVPGSTAPPLHVVGIGASISPYTDAWVVPSQIAGMVSRQAPLREQMLYRVEPATTDLQIANAARRITHGLPAAAVVSVDSYLQVMRNADLKAAVMTPFLLAFSAFALAASVLIIANIVSGVVLGGYRHIGIMKSIGFTPVNVLLVLLGQILVPALAACAAGIILGTLASEPFLAETAAALGLPAPFAAVLPVDLGVLLLVVVVILVAALLPARRAATMSAVSAMTRGSAPSRSGSTRLSSGAARLPLPRTLTLGVGDALARPTRAALTGGAIITGVAAVVFGLDLHLSLAQVQRHLDRTEYVQVSFYLPSPGPDAPGKPGAPAGLAHPPAARQVERALKSDPRTVRYVAEGSDDVSLAGIAQPIPYYAYQGTSNWLGYALVDGRWFRTPGEVVVPSRVLQTTHLQVGDRTTVRLGARTAQVTIVGEILDQSDDNLLLRGPWATLHTLDPKLPVTQFDVHLKAGVNPYLYERQIQQSGPLQGSALGGDVNSSRTDTTFILFNSVIGGLALVLLVVAIAGVFNTVVLNTRERVREIAILKAIGMTPRQVIGMVLASVALLGLLAGIPGILVGMYLHAQVLTLMGSIASGTRIPPAFLSLVSPRLYPLLAGAGVVIAVLGAWLPARWAAAGRTAETLQAE